jgi:hypothetical protein
VWRLRETAKLKERSMSELSLRAPKRLRDDAIELRLLSAEDAPALFGRSIRAVMLCPAEQQPPGGCSARPLVNERLNP